MNSNERPPFEEVQESKIVSGPKIEAISDTITNQNGDGTETVIHRFKGADGNWTEETFVQASTDEDWIAKAREENKAKLAHPVFNQVDSVMKRKDFSPIVPLADALIGDSEKSMYEARVINEFPYRETDPLLVTHEESEQRRMRQRKEIMDSVKVQNDHPDLQTAFLDPETSLVDTFDNSNS